MRKGGASAVEGCEAVQEQIAPARQYHFNLRAVRFKVKIRLWSLVTSSRESFYERILPFTHQLQRYTHSHLSYVNGNLVFNLADLLSKCSL